VDRDEAVELAGHAAVAGAATVVPPAGLLAVALARRSRAHSTPG
jgi:hypothetical protein